LDVAISNEGIGERIASDGIKPIARHFVQITRPGPIVLRADNRGFDEPAI
jgi:hypothetical protein